MLLLKVTKAAEMKARMFVIVWLQLAWKSLWIILYTLIC